MNFLKSLKKYIYHWNRKIHIYIGLFLLLFIWLYSYSGLLLNHGNWRISNFWEQREQFETNATVKIPETRNSTELIKDITSQLDIEGEVTNVKMWADSIYFRVSVPGHVQDLKVYFESGRCVQSHLKFNLTGIIRTMHTFNGVDRNDASSKPNWLITKIWRLSMDGVAIGLILTCISSWMMWFNVRKTFPWSFTVLLAGFAIAFYFLFVLAKL